ncbi:hypothetical protein [Pseudomonas sp. RIT-PI-S]|uniref:hypothetical protein n=1 Tax=Pseudomonas sp. RIT-PI-S TaxID=3035295 RepID=UPI0021D907D2|nr:hypothetical protein [Pseudomonas sp. RIT-PI-S]
MQAETPINLEQRFAFEEWAKGHGLDVRAEGDGRFVAPATQLAWEGYQACCHRLAGRQPLELFARIRPRSEYAHQANRMIRDGHRYPFPVALARDTNGYVVKGGVGGCYRLKDVDLIAVVDGAELELTGKRGGK